MSKTSPCKFWKYINKFKCSPSDRNNLDSDSFVYHFSNNSNLQHSNFNADDFIQSHDAPLYIEQLDCPISVEEVSKTILLVK
jgi:hypothetical protein